MGKKLLLFFILFFAFQINTFAEEEEKVFYVDSALESFESELGGQESEILETPTVIGKFPFKKEINKNEKLRIKTEYSFLYQNLADEFKLDAHKFGIRVTENPNEKTDISAIY